MSRVQLAGCVATADMVMAGPDAEHTHLHVYLTCTARKKWFLLIVKTTITRIVLENKYRHVVESHLIRRTF